MRANRLHFLCSSCQAYRELDSETEPHSDSKQVEEQRPEHCCRRHHGQSHQGRHIRQDRCDGFECCVPHLLLRAVAQPCCVRVVRGVAGGVGVAVDVEQLAWVGVELREAPREGW